MNYLARLSGDQRDTLEATLTKYLPLVPGDYPSALIDLDAATFSHLMKQVLAWQQLEVDVLDAYTDWLEEVTGE